MMFSKTRNTIKEILKDLEDWNRNIQWFMPPIWYCLVKTFSKNKEIDISEFEFNLKVKTFLNSLNFYENNFKSQIDKILPIRTINSQDWLEVDEITNEFWDLIKKFLWAWNEKLASNMVKMLGELLNNIAHHSWTPDIYNKNQAFIEANYQSWQYFEWANLIQIAIVDSGIWILSSVRKKDRSIQNSEEAIKKALEPNFTWWTVLNNSWISNAWIWLTVTLEMIKELKWDIFIWSKECLFSYNWNTQEELYEMIPSWKWTFVVLNIYTNNGIDIDILDIRNKYLKNDENFDLDLNFW